MIDRLVLLIFNKMNELLGQLSNQPSPVYPATCSSCFLNYLVSRCDTIDGTCDIGEVRIQKKNLVRKSQKEDVGLDRGRVLNVTLKEYIVNVGFGFNCP